MPRVRVLHSDGSNLFVSSVPIRTFGIIYDIHELAKIVTCVEEYLGALALFTLIKQSLAGHALGTPGIFQRCIIG